MAMLLYTHPDMFDHKVQPGHPERPERLAAVLDALRGADDLALEEREAPLAADEAFLLVHTPAYLAAIKAAVPETGIVKLDPDTPISPGSLVAARRAAGAVEAAVRAVAAGETLRAFCAVRPPGHHAEIERAMGFCVFSNVAIGARIAQGLGLARVAVVDFDVHHGNGTQDIFEADPTLFFASVHQWPCYPGTGRPSEHGVGNIINAVAPPDAPREIWRKAFSSLLAPLDAFDPDLILISAGFDAHAADPLAEQNLIEDDYAWATRAIVEIAERRCGGRVVSSLEGGYDLEALGRSAVAHVRALSEG
jgi:acetoin utilization deacetylase AcuC-like enzyme